jgi:Protein of unknown function (DUF2934)
MLAYQLWERGRPLGSPEIDWYAAESALGVRHSQEQFSPPGCPLRGRRRCLSRTLSSTWLYMKDSSQTLDFDEV